MRNLLILTLLALTIASCAGQKEIELNSIVQSPCKEQTKLKDTSEFTGETVSNLLVYQKSNKLYVSMDVRTFSNAHPTFKLQRKNTQIKLLLINDNSSKDSSICNITVTTSIKNVQPGTYEIMVLNSSGTQLLATKKITFIE